jgi:hypothetical protein
MKTERVRPDTICSGFSLLVFFSAFFIHGKFSFAYTGVIGIVLAIISLIRRERDVWFSLLGLAVNALSLLYAFALAMVSGG